MSLAVYTEAAMERSTITKTHLSLYHTLQAAEEIGVAPRHATVLRLRFLQEEILELEGRRRYCEYLKEKNSKWLRQSGEIFSLMYQQEMIPMKAEVQSLEDYLNGKTKITNNGSQCSPEMIERARNFPIADLIGQIPKGASKVVRCPFHTDKGPSASVKNNVLFCFAGCRPKKVGRKGWDPILLLMERDGMSFPAAVKALQ